VLIQVSKIFDDINTTQPAAALAAASDDGLGDQLTIEDFAAMKRDVEKLGEFAVKCGEQLHLTRQFCSMGILLVSCMLQSDTAQGFCKAIKQHLAKCTPTMCISCRASAWLWFAQLHDCQSVLQKLG
jgi:hypothetical protein